MVLNVHRNHKAYWEHFNMGRVKVHMTSVYMHTSASCSSISVILETTNKEVILLPSVCPSDDLKKAATFVVPFTVRSIQTNLFMCF